MFVERMSRHLIVMKTYYVLDLSCLYEAEGKRSPSLLQQLYDTRCRNVHTIQITTIESAWGGICSRAKSRCEGECTDTEYNDNTAPGRRRHLIPLLASTSHNHPDHQPGSACSPATAACHHPPPDQTRRPLSSSAPSTGPTCVESASEEVEERGNSARSSNATRHYPILGD